MGRSFHLAPLENPDQAIFAQGIDLNHLIPGEALEADDLKIDRLYHFLPALGPRGAGGKETFSVPRFFRRMVLSSGFA